MRAIKIDPAAKTITEIELKRPNQSLQEFYDLIGCDLVQLVELDRGIVMACDEEAKCRKITGAFTFYGTDRIIAGNAVILGGDAERFGKLHEDIASFEKIIDWVEPADVPEPKFTLIPLTSERN